MQIESLMQILQNQVQESKQIKMKTMMDLKKQKIKETSLLKKKLKDTRIHHKADFMYCPSQGSLFTKTVFLQPRPIRPAQEHFKPPWHPNNSTSRLLSPNLLDTEVTPRQIEPKEKVWRPFSGQPNRLKQIQLQPHSAKPNPQQKECDQLRVQKDNKFIPLRQFSPVRRIASAFPAVK